MKEKKKDEDVGFMEPVVLLELFQHRRHRGPRLYANHPLLVEFPPPAFAV
jgi:hypothetical protein